MAALYRQDVFANNLANMDSAGFKPDIPSTSPRLAVRQEDGVMHLPSDKLLEKLGGGAWLNPNRIDMRQGSPRAGGPMDVSIEGDGFFVVQDGSTPGEAGIRLTRDGRFTRNTQGELVMSTTGMRVLDAANLAITLADDAPVVVDGAGKVMQRGKIVAELGFVEVNEAGLRKRGHSQFTVDSSAWNARKPATGTMRQGYYEDSAVDEMRALLAVTSASREVDLNVDMMRTHDRLSERAIASLGRTLG
jgi:flagellar basal-body rod protein FlgF